MLSCISTLPCSPSQCCSYFCFLCHMPDNRKGRLFLPPLSKGINLMRLAGTVSPLARRKFFLAAKTTPMCNFPSSSVCQGLTKSCWERGSLTQNICLVPAAAPLPGSSPCRQWPSLYEAKDCLHWKQLHAQRE